MKKLEVLSPIHDQKKIDNPIIIVNKLYKRKTH